MLEDSLKQNAYASREQLFLNALANRRQLVKEALAIQVTQMRDAAALQTTQIQQQGVPREGSTLTDAAHGMPAPALVPKENVPVVKA